MGETDHWPEMRRRSSGEISAASSPLLVDPCNTDLRIEGRRIDEALDARVEGVPGALALDPGTALAAAELPLRQKGREHAREALL